MDQKKFLYIPLFLLIIVGAFLFFGGIRQSQPLPTPSTTTSELDVIASAIDEKLPLWVELWKNIEPDFDVADFRKISEQTISQSQEYVFNAISEEDLNKVFYVYSPDRTKFINPQIYLELMSMEKNDQIIAAHDVDSGVALVDLETMMGKTLLVCGTPCSFDDALWMSNDVFVVVGKSEYYPLNGEERCSEGVPCTSVATLHVFDLSKNTVTLYYGPENVRSIAGYLERKYPDIQF